MAPSVLVFLCELFLLEGVAEDSADDSALVDFSALPDFLELFVPELDGLPAVSPADSSLAPFVVWSPL